MNRKLHNRMLLVGPESPERNQFLDALERRGFAVLLAETGEKALRTLRENLVDCVVLDYRTPYNRATRTTGESRSLEAITDANPLLPLVLTCDPTDDLSYAETRMADIILTRPVASSALLEAVDTVLTETLSERALRKAGSIAMLR